MASQFVVVVRDFRDAPTVTSETEPMGLATELNAAHSHNEGDAWAYCRNLGEYFSRIAVGSISANISVMNATTSAFATITSSGTNVSNGDTLVINGTTITFVTAAPVGSQVQIGGTAPETLQNLINFINNGGNAEAFAGIVIAIRTAPLVVTILSTLPGTAGNSITITKVAASLTLSGATLTGGVAIATQHVISAGL